jgi:acetyl esterase/lipase
VRITTVLLAAAITISSEASAGAQIRVVRDIDFVPNAAYRGGKDRLDVYIPRNANKAPVIVSVYGGALREGDKSDHAFVGERFASSGYVTVVVNYRLSPEVMHPAHVEDVAASVAWVTRHVGEYGGDPDKVVLTGHSAGAYLVALVVLDPRYLGAHGLTPRDVRGAAPVSGFFYVDRTGVAPDRPRDTWGSDPAVWRRASPAAYVRSDVPPMLLLYADGDEPWRRQQQRDFAVDLRRAGAGDVQTRSIGGKDHNSVWFEMADGEDETARSIIGFVERVLKQP